MAAKRITYPLVLPPELDEQIAIAAERLCMPKSEVMRMALAIGLEDLRRIDYKLAAAIVSAARQEDRPQLKVAEDLGEVLSPFIRAPGAPAVKYPRGRIRES